MIQKQFIYKQQIHEIALNFEQLTTELLQDAFGNQVQMRNPNRRQLRSSNQENKQLNSFEEETRRARKGLVRVQPSSRPSIVVDDVEEDNQQLSVVNRMELLYKLKMLEIEKCSQVMRLVSKRVGNRVKVNSEFEVQLDIGNLSKVEFEIVNKVIEEVDS